MSKLPERDSLGWLAQSAVPPKKQKLIEGVGASSLVELKAQLYKTQLEAKGIKDGTIDPSARAAKRLKADPMSSSNAGVQERNQRDKLHIKTDAERSAECYAALERKAQLYDKLAAGGYNSDDEERYNVDFLYKELEERKRGGHVAAAAPDTMADAAYGNRGGMDTEGMAMERERRAWEEDQHRQHAQELEEEQKRKQRTEAVLEVAEELAAQREKAAASKASRQQQLDRKRDRLKAAFIQKQLEKAKQQQPGST